MAAEAFATGFLANISSEVLKKLGVFATHELGLMLGFRGEQQKLKNSVEMIVAVLEDAEVRQAKDNAVRLWLQRLKQAVYDAEDVLDVVAYEALRRNMEKRFNNKVHKFVWLPIRLAFRLKMARKVQGVIRKLDEIAKQKNDLHLKEGQASANKTSLHRDTSYFIDDSEVIGREEEKSKIIKMLLDESVVNKGENFSVISVVGFGGIGKTTLAQSIYNDEVVSKGFAFKKWVCVANDDSSEKNLLGEVFLHICENQPRASNKVQMQEKLEEKLKGKKILLVFDDVWSSSQWDDVRVILKCSAPGSKVIVTTRIQKVANDMGVVHDSLKYLNQLSEDHCRAIFEKRAFGSGGPDKTRDLEVIGWEIVKNCHGVPLAVKAMGSLLHSKKTINEWMTIKNSENLNVVGDNVVNVLRLSYDHLPSPVKQCFQYCAIFPKDATIMKADLIQQWMAHGFIQCSNDLEMDKVGNDYFKTLCCNSFFQNMKLDKNHDITSCKMHDLVHDLARLIMGKELLVLSHITPTENVNLGETRHLTVKLDKEREFSFPEDLFKKLRMFISKRPVANDAWVNFKFIRVLHLNDIKEVSSSICKLILLRCIFPFKATV